VAILVLPVQHTEAKVVSISNDATYLEDSIMMKTITSHWFSAVWTIVVMMLSTAASIYTQDPSYVARAGALLTLAGIFMTTRRLLVQSAEKQSFDPLKHASKQTLMVDLEVSEQEEIEHLKAEKCGFWFLIMGTIVWAYGDLVLSALTGW